MTYRSYEERIQRIAVLTKTVRRYAKLIAAVLLTSVALLVGYLFARGLMIGGVTCTPVLEYGDAISPDCFILFGSPTYEYAPYDTQDWTETAPITPGKYQVRAYSHRSFGIIDHSEPTVFTIERRKVFVTVEGHTLEYGDQPSLDVTNLLTGDEIDTKTVEFVFDEPTRMSTNIHIPEESVRIFNQQGHDVTSAYHITTEDQRVSIVPRKVTVTLENATKVYDGTPLTSDGWSVAQGDILEGDTLTLTFSESIVNVGEIRNIPEWRVSNAQGEAVNGWYEVSFAEGTGILTVTPCPLHITTTDEEAIYDGNPLTGSFAADTDSLLPAGHSITDAVFSPITNVGSQENTCVFAIRNSKGEDVTKNFAITESWGTLTIIKRPIIVCTPDGEKVYDGEPLSNRQAHLKAGQDYMLVAGHSLDYGFDSGNATEVIHVGSYANEVPIRILDANGTVCTDNYEVIPEYGTLTVTKRPVEIRSGDHEWTYDGLAHEYTDCDDSDLLDGHRFVAVKSASVVHFKAEGYPNTVEEYTILDSAGNDITGNYEVTVVPGTLRINKREIHVQTGSAEREYNAQPLSKTDGYSMLDGTAMVEGDYFVVSAPSAQTDVGETQNVFTDHTGGGYVILNGDQQDVTDNYVCTFTYGVLRVNKRVLTVVTLSAEKVYDGTPLSCREYTAAELIQGHVITLREGASYRQLTNVGSVKNDVSARNLRVYADGVDVTSNYSITMSTEVGALTVTPRPVTVYTGDATKMYDGTDLVCTEYRFADETPVVEGHRLSVSTSTRMTTVGTEENVFRRYQMLDAGGANVTGNYQITLEYGTLTVQPRAITVRMGDATREFDDRFWVHTAYTVISEMGLVEGHTLEVTTSTSIRDVGSLNNELLDWRIYGADGTDLTENYAVTGVSGSLQVTPRALHITTPRADAYYNGQELSCRSGFSQTGLLAGHTITVTDSTVLVKAGYVPNEFTIEIRRADGSVVPPSNYDVTYTHGYLEVRPARIVVNTPSYSRVYTGTPLSFTRYLNNTVGIPSDHTIEAIEETLTRITDVGSVENRFAVRICNAQGEDVTDSCFVIQYQYGKLTVTKREITVTSDNLRSPFVYDGTAQSYSVGTCLYGTSLAEEQRLYLDTQGTMTVPTHIGGAVINRVLSAVVRDKNGNDVSGNYRITLEDGFLYMDPRPIVLKPADAEKEYDGTPLTSNVPEILERNGYYDLVGGHRIELITEGSQTEIGWGASWIVSHAIYDANGVNMNSYYQVMYESATLRVVRCRIQVKTMDATKVYDGTPLRCTDYEILSGTLAQNHRLIVDDTSIPELLNVGSLKNRLVFLVVDENGMDVTEQYNISREETGTLRITPRDITLGTDSMTKLFDGQPLQAEGMNVLEGSLADGHSVNATDFASITSPGQIRNTCTWEILDGNGNDVTSNYNVTLQIGTLKVESDGYLDESGDLTKDPLPDVETNEDNIIRVKGTVSGIVYLRFRSFGNYTGMGFSKDVNAYYLGEDMVHPQLWASHILAQAGYKEAALDIILPRMQYLTPYYLVTGGLQGDDVRFNETTLEYALSYIPGTLTDVLSRPETLPEEMAADELAYRNYVYANYLQIPYELRGRLMTIIAENRLEGSYRQTIYNIANYVRNRMDYNENFAAIPEDVQDIVLYFLTEMDGAICQHYAAAATMLYRAAGIPARYCVGYRADVVADEWVEIGPEQAHAWVEIYVDGKGWLPVEVTNSFAGDIVDKLEFKPYDIHVTYDGRVHGPVGDEYWETTGNLPEGYRVVDVVLEGAQINAGVYQTYISSLRILDPKGNDVTDQFDVTLTPADLIIDPREIVLTTGSVDVPYDGLVHSNPEWKLESGSLAEGHVCEGKVTMSTGRVGEWYNLLSYFTIKDQDGNVIFHGTAYYDEQGFLWDSITGTWMNYRIRTEYGVFRISWN